MSVVTHYSNKDEDQIIIKEHCSGVQKLKEVAYIGLSTNLSFSLLRKVDIDELLKVQIELAWGYISLC